MSENCLFLLIEVKKCQKIAWSKIVRKWTKKVYKCLIFFGMKMLTHFKKLIIEFLVKLGKVVFDYFFRFLKFRILTFLRMLQFSDIFAHGSILWHFFNPETINLEYLKKFWHFCHNVINDKMSEVTYLI